MIWLGVVAILLLMLFGAPLFAVIAAAAMLGFWASDIDLTVLAIEMYRIADTPLLIALPLFTFVGYVLSAARTSERLVALTQALLGWMPAGLAVVALLTCAFFTALTGASGVTIVALGALLYPALLQGKYPDHFSLGLVTSSGSLGLLLAPSVPLILYGVVAQQLDLGQPIEINHLFLAGIFPALLMVGLLGLYAAFVGVRAGVGRQAFSARVALAALWAARWELPLPVIVLGGVFGGFFAVSEAAVVTALYVLLAEVVLYRDVKLAQLPGLMREAMVMVGGILLILAVSLAFTNFLVDAEVPQQLFTLVQSAIQSKWAFLILLNIGLLVLGAMLDIFAAIVIMVPLILPVAVGYGIHPVHLGIIFLANMQIGYFTPPIGMNLFIASFRFKRSIAELTVACVPFILVLLVALALITYVPAISLALLPETALP
jgi:tripartite ATP-independent transporter DctM subunit